MFKFLRKYSVWILGFGGTLLLIAFLAPNVIQQLAQRAGYSGSIQAKVGDGEKIGYDEWQINVRESQIAERFFPPIGGLVEVESPSHWLLLSREADLAGLARPWGAGFNPRTIFSIMINLKLDPFTSDLQTVVGTIAQKAGVAPQLVLETLAHYDGISLLVQMYQTAGRFSDRRLHKAADDYFSAASVETIVIQSIPEDNGSFSTEAMQAQIDTWGDVPEGEGDYGFGYQLPDRFKAEWLVIPSSTITETARQSSEFSSKEQRKFWRRNENDPRFPEVGNSSEIPEEVKNAYLEQLATIKRSEIARSASEYLRNPRRGIDESGGFLDLPEDWDTKKLSLETLATTLQEEFTIALPKYGSYGEWTSTDEAASTPLVGDFVAINLGDTPVDFKTLVSSAKEFNANGIFRIQEAVTSSVLESRDGDLVLFRLTDTDPARAPLNHDEVREQVTYDLGRIARWDTLRAESDLIEQHARENGMLATSVKYGATVSSPRPVSMIETGAPLFLGPTDRRSSMSNSIKQQIASGYQISDMATNIPTLQKNDRNLIQTIIDKASALPIDVPVSSLPIEERVFIVQSPENMALVLIRLTGTTPASNELAYEFTGGSDPILQTLISLDELGGISAIGEVFSFDALTTRHNFERGSRDVALEETDVN